MKKIIGIICIGALLFASVCARAAEDEWLVSDDLEYTPDIRYQARVLMRNMTLDDRIMQLFIVNPEMLTGEKYTVSLKNAKELMAEYPVGGVILYGQNIVSESQLQDLTGAFQTGAQEARKMPLFVAVDEEGGSVSRIANKLGYAFLPAPGETQDEEAAFLSGSAIGAYLKPLGINLDFAPVADVKIGEEGGIGLRSFSAYPSTVSAMASRMASGLRQEGVIPCYKHFPGIGGTARDTHNGRAVSLRTMEEMRGTELIPFERGVLEKIEMIMVSHLTFRELDREYPSALSHAVITGLLRTEMGYDGVIITDAMRMRAVTTEFTQKQALILSIQAGADMILLPQNLKAAARYIKDAVANGTLTEERIDESVERILALKIAFGLIE